METSLSTFPSCSSYRGDGGVVGGGIDPVGLLNSVILRLCPRLFAADASPSTLDGRGIWLAAGPLSDSREGEDARGFSGESGSVSNSSGGSCMRFAGNDQPNREGWPAPGCASLSSCATRTGDGEREGGTGDARCEPTVLAARGVLPFMSNAIELCVRTLGCPPSAGARLVRGRKLCVRCRPDRCESDAELSLRSFVLGLPV